MNRPVEGRTQELPTETGWYYVRMDDWWSYQPRGTIFPIHVRKYKNGSFRVAGKIRSSLTSIESWRNHFTHLEWFGPVATIEEKRA